MTPGVTCIAPSVVCCLPLMMPIMLLLLLCSWRKVHAVSCLLQTCEQRLQLDALLEMLQSKRCTPLFVLRRQLRTGAVSHNL
jgi:hypothetical protein